MTDWPGLARVLRAGARRTWGIQEPGTYHLGNVLEAMAGECDKLAQEEEDRGKEARG